MALCAGLGGVEVRALEALGMGGDYPRLEGPRAGGWGIEQAFRPVVMNECATRIFDTLEDHLGYGSDSGSGR